MADKGTESKATEGMYTFGQEGKTGYVGVVTCGTGAQQRSGYVCLRGSSKAAIQS